MQLLSATKWITEQSARFLSNMCNAERRYYSVDAVDKTSSSAGATHQLTFFVALQHLANKSHYIICIHTDICGIKLLLPVFFFRY